MATTLESAFEELRKNEDLAKEFTEQPEKVLKQLGVDTKKVKIQKTPDKNTFKPRREEGSGGARAATAGGTTVCSSYGMLSCVSVGSDVPSIAGAPPSGGEFFTPGPSPTISTPPAATRGAPYKRRR